MKRHRETRKAYAAILLVAAAALVYYGYAAYGQPASLSETALQSRFSYLSQAHSNLCALPEFIYSMENGTYLQGSCCSAMNFTAYAEQVSGLRRYSGIAQIPDDPYNISVSLAKELLGYQSIALNAEEQRVYNQSLSLANPCCCGCWRWYAFEGQAKYLITRYEFNSSQIATVWELEDGCGGPADF